MKHNNPTIAEDSVRLFNLKTGEGLSEVSPIIVPTVEINPRINIVKRNTCTNATSVTLYTTPTDKDFYLTGVSLSHTRDVNATCVSTAINGVIDGVSTGTIFIEHRMQTLTAGNIPASTQSFSIPIKIDRGTAITITASTNVGNFVSVGIIFGYTVETVKGV